MRESECIALTFSGVEIWWEWGEADGDRKTKLMIKSWSCSSHRFGCFKYVYITISFLKTTNIKLFIVLFFYQWNHQRTSVKKIVDTLFHQVFGEHLTFKYQYISSQVTGPLATKRVSKMKNQKEELAIVRAWSVFNPYACWDIKCLILHYVLVHCFVTCCIVLLLSILLCNLFHCYVTNLLHCFLSYVIAQQRDALLCKVTHCFIWRVIKHRYILSLFILVLHLCLWLFFWRQWYCWLLRFLSGTCPSSTPFLYSSSLHPRRHNRRTSSPVAFVQW